MNRISFGRRFATVFIVFTLILLGACGGGGSSTGSGSFVAGSASLAGNVNSGIAWHDSAARPRPLLISLLELATTEARAAGVGGVEVRLVLDGVVVASQTTGASGDFVFNGLQPGNYTVRLSQGGRQGGVSPVIQLDANTRTRLEMRLDGELMELEIDAANSRISGEVEDEREDDRRESEDHDEDEDHGEDHDEDDDRDDEDDDDEDDDDEDDRNEEDECDDDEDDDECRA